MKNDHSDTCLPFPKQFDEFMQITGKTYRDVQRRATVEFSRDGRNYFIKKHFGIGWKEIVKNLLKFKRPILGARSEWLALKHLKKHQIAAPVPVTYGKRGINPAKQQSFIVTEALKNKKSLNSLILEWRDRTPEFNFKVRLIKQLAETINAMHQSGLNHRDCYTVHFWVNENLHLSLPENLPPITVIDLHRAQIRRKVPKRWLIKDLSGLYFSVKMMMPITKNNLLRFIKYYTNKPLREILKNDKRFWRHVQRKGEKLRQKHEKNEISYCEEQLLHVKTPQIISKKNFRFRLLGNKEYQHSFIQPFIKNPGKLISTGAILKKEQDASVFKITLNNHTFIIKHYHPKRLKCRLKNFVRKSFAMRNWENTLRLLSHGLSAPNPVLMIEKRFGPLKKHSYFVSSYLDGETLADILNTQIEAVAPPDSPLFKNTEWLEKKIQRLFNRFRELKFSHGDLDSENLLLKNGIFFLIDLDHGKWFRTAFFAKHRLEKDQMRFLRNFRKLPNLRKKLTTLINKKLARRLARYDWRYEKKCLKKIFQETNEITRKSSFKRRVIGYKKYSTFMDKFSKDPDKMLAEGDMLKRGSSTTVVKITHDNCHFVIKRYRPKTFLRRLKNLLRTSLAAKSWKNSHRLLFHDLETPKPILILEKRFGPLIGTNYSVSQYIEGVTLTDALRNSKSETNKNALLDIAKQLLHQFEALNFFHGDLKGTNLIMQNNRIFLIDIEHCKRFYHPFSAKHRLEKDRKRLFKNFD